MQHSHTLLKSHSPNKKINCSRCTRSCIRSTRTLITASSTDPLLLRVARGEQAERTPVWLMRQAGRYMADFRKFSDTIPFRERSETASIAIELSLQPWNAFQPDGVIMFSDILTPLPALGIEFDVIKGKGPRIDAPIRDMDAVRRLNPMEDPALKLPFVGETLRTLRQEVDGQATLLGFIGTPWTLAAYTIEGKAERNCRATKTMMMKQPQILHALLGHLTHALADYVVYQIDSGAQVVQLFDSWAHHLSPDQFEEFSLPYAEKVMESVRARRPGVPLIFHANGGAGKHELLKLSTADVIGLDWECSMKNARAVIGSDRTLQGNVDPTVLFGDEKVITAAVEKCLKEAGPRRHILNVGHGVIEGTPEESVGIFCDLARKSASLFQTA
jgi:uroporphyrinogen decarboxylase